MREKNDGFDFFIAKENFLTAKETAPCQHLEISKIVLFDKVAFHFKRYILYA